MEVGTTLSVTLSLETEMIRCTAVVVTKYPQVGNGIDFISMEPHDRLKLHAFIEELERRTKQS